MEKKTEVVIIGAGIAGLSIGCYLQMNGFNVQIFESHNIPGGLCTSWKRGEYQFDGCIHSTIAPNDKYRLSNWLGELVDFDLVKYHYHDELSCIKFPDGTVFHFATNPDKLEKDLLEIAPEDEKFIRAMSESIRVFAKHDLQMAKPIELWTPLDYFSRQFISAPYLSHLTKWSKSLMDTISKCQNVKLKQILKQDFFTRYPFYFFLIGLGQMNNKGAGYPMGGSLNFAKHIEQKFISLGGRIQYDSKVNKIIISENAATGVILESGEMIEDRDIVISAADGYETLYQLLDGKFTDQKIKDRYDNYPRWPSIVLVSLGVARTFYDEPSSVDIRLKNEFVIDGSTKTDTLPVTIYNFDPSLAPEGKTCIRVILHTQNYDYWKTLKDSDHEKYTQEKNRIGNDIVAILDNHLCNIKNNLEVMDISTPATFYRYTNNWQGSIQGWEWVPKLIPDHMKNDVPGLKNFWMTGQWVMPGGGVAGAFINARDTARIICKKRGIKFSVK